MLNQVRSILLDAPKKVDSRLESLKMLSNQDIITCLNIIGGFGVEVCTTEKIGVIKTLRRLSKDGMGLKHAKDVVEVLTEACREDSNACETLKNDLLNIS